MADYESKVSNNITTRSPAPVQPISRLDVLLASRPREVHANPLLQLLAVAAAAQAPRYASQLVSIPTQQAAAQNASQLQSWTNSVALAEREEQRALERRLQEMKGEQAAEQARLNAELNAPKTQAEIERAKAAAARDNAQAAVIPLDSESRRKAEEARTLREDVRLRTDIGNRFFDNALKLGTYAGSDQATPGGIRLLAPEFMTARTLTESALGRLNQSPTLPQPASDTSIKALGDTLLAEPSARQRDMAAQTANREAATSYLQAQTVTEGERAKQEAAQTEVLKAEVLLKRAQTAKTLREMAEIDERLAIERTKLSQGERQLRESIQSRSVNNLLTVGKTAAEQGMNYLKQADELEKAATATKVNDKDGTRTALLPPETQRKMLRQARQYRALAHRALQTGNTAAQELRKYGIQLPTVALPDADGVTVERID